MGSRHWEKEHPGLGEDRFGFLKWHKLPRKYVGTYKAMLKCLNVDEKHVHREECTTHGPPQKEEQQPAKVKERQAPAQNPCKKAASRPGRPHHPRS